MTTDATRLPGSGRKPGPRGARWLPMFYLAPSLALFAVFIAFPFLRAIWFSFNETSFLGGVVGFVGTGNYKAIFTDVQFSRYVGNSVVWVVGAVSLQAIFGLAGALLLNQNFRLRGVVRGLAMIPWATPSVLVSLIWMWMLEPNHGVINQALLGMGVIDAPIAWLGQSSTAMGSLIVIDTWQGIPFFAVMILAALQGVPADLKDAARTDGCGPLAVFRHVVIPYIIPTIVITIVLRVIWTANYVDLAYVLTGGGPARATTTMPLQSYLTAYKGGDFGQGAAYAMVQAAVLAVMVVFYVRLTSEKEK